MRGLPVERSKLNYATEWTTYYENVMGDEAKLHFFIMLKNRRDQKQDSEAGKVLEELVARWIKEKAR